MPALSPTMEVGSIAQWNLKEGDMFEAGTAICEVINKNKHAFIHIHKIYTRDFDAIYM